ncbi:MAG: hypothetical protein DWP97_06075 [Calditrichaeota bacterium]|nr:MAG: hypothetical protein DWP97_06075 [Calditrichota bacterium]
MTKQKWRNAYIDPVCFAESILEIELHPGQKKWLRDSFQKENLLVTGNRWGKSFVSAVKILYRAVFKIRDIRYSYKQKYRIVTASITQDQANIIFNQVVRIARESKILEPLILTITKTPFPKLEFSNGSSIEARSTQNRGEYLLGNDYDYFIFDEVAFEADPEYVVEEVIMMRLADRDGILDLVSTPNGKNWFYKRFSEIKSNQRTGYIQSGDTRENQFISERAVKDRIQNFSDRRIHQNIMGQFVDSGGEILKSEYVEKALERIHLLDKRKLTDNDGFYISGWDLARKQTATVGITVKVIDGNAFVVALERLQMVDWDVVIEKIKARQRKYPGRLIVDATGLGDVMVQQLSEYNPTPVVFTQVVKGELLTNVEFFHVQNKIAYGRWELLDSQGKIWSLEDELKEARWDNNNKCDSLMALALAIWPLYKRDRFIIDPRVGTI